MNAPFAHSTARPWSEVPESALRGVVGVLTDIDDTLTTEGDITVEALAALVALRRAGLPVIAVTGRPLGWCEPRARAWPLDAVVGESGALALFTLNGELKTEFAQDPATRQANALRLQAVGEQVLREVPGATLSYAPGVSATDLSIDHGEHAHLDAAQIDQVVRIMKANGMTATVSSIHVNGWFGDHTKLSGARWIVQRLLGRSIDAERGRWIYVGDSTNDEVAFGFFPLSVGVANVMRFADRLKAWPSYVTPGERGAGFAEVAAAVLAAR